MAAPRIVHGPREETPFAVDAIVEEEDSYLSLSAEPALTMTGEHPVRVMTAAREAKEVEPGTVVVRPGKPLKLLAVVHRLHETPTWQEAWIVAALRNLSTEVASRRIRALGTPLLGTVHGKMSPKASFELMTDLLFREKTLERVWIVTT